MSKRRVVVTGMGMLSPVGNNVKTAWDNILAGKSGIGPIEHFDVSEFAVRFGGSVRGFDVSTIMSSKDARKMDPFIHYGIAAAIEAV
ncbi:MAG: beta-ketoacyl synthase N-terminal-like domain-containing protein, partial [Thiohalophilus sp.]